MGHLFSAAVMCLGLRELAAYFDKSKLGLLQTAWLYVEIQWLLWNMTDVTALLEGSR